MKSYTLIFTLVAAVITGGCQTMAEISGNAASPFRSSEKKFVQRTINEWAALSRAEIRWNEVPLTLQDRNLDNLPTLVRFLRHRVDQEGVPFAPSCFPRATTYPRSRHSITKQELILVAAALGALVAVCNATPDSEKYQIDYESLKWMLTRLREVGLAHAGMQNEMVCDIDERVQQYKQQNPGRPVDGDVLDWIKDNQLWNCAIE